MASLSLRDRATFLASKMMTMMEAKKEYKKKMTSHQVARLVAPALAEEEKRAIEEDLVGALQVKVPLANSALEICVVPPPVVATPTALLTIRTPRLRRSSLPGQAMASARKLINPIFTVPPRPAKEEILSAREQSRQQFPRIMHASGTTFTAVLTAQVQALRRRAKLKLKRQ